MGGRGRGSGLGVRQFSFNDELRRNKISVIIRENKIKREAATGKGGGSGSTASPSLFKKCACCGEYTIPIGSKFETCPVCGWIDDPFQNQYPDSLKGKNVISLTQARSEFTKK